MSFIALVGSVTTLLDESRLQKIILPLVAFASGSLIGGAIFHMLPASVDRMGNGIDVYVWLAIGFASFLALEQVLRWHHCHRPPSHHKQPLGYLILIADGLHNLIGGLSIGALFVADIRLGITAWIAAAFHEVPQELGDFGVLVHGGWKRYQALLFNLLSGLTFPLGGVIAYFVSQDVDIDFLIPFAAGNFLYIGAVDLVPEFKDKCGDRPSIIAGACWMLGMAILLGLRFVV
ncbi:MAG: ZIP family metal transporter [Acidimicrobiia bacterium]|nr:ZIP family metal transporter [Acidimicrobiia bacterium]NNF64489.1 ZIP family metal transporter [Acidimicrobiia bacterium]